MKRTSIKSLLWVYLFLASCSFKTVLHPYPPQHQKLIENEPYRLEIQLRDDGYFLINHMVDDTTSLDYRWGTLEIDENDDPFWTKSDSFILPPDSTVLFLDSFAYYDEKTEMDIVTTEIFNQTDSLIATINEVPENAYIQYGDRTLVVRLADSWPDGYQKVEQNGTSYFHNYPLGGELNLFEEGKIRVKIIQGGVIGKALGRDSYRGISYAVVFQNEPDLDDFTETIAILMAYISFNDMHFYYYECEYRDPEPDGSCPDSILVK